MRRQDTDTATCRRVPITAAAGRTEWGETPCPHPRSILNPREPIPDSMFPSQISCEPIPDPLFLFPIPVSPSQTPVSPSQKPVLPSWNQCPCPRPELSDHSIPILYPQCSQYSIPDPRIPSQLPVFPMSSSQIPVLPVPPPCAPAFSALTVFQVPPSQSSQHPCAKPQCPQCPSPLWQTPQTPLRSDRSQVRSRGTFRRYAQVQTSSSPNTRSPSRE